MTGLPFDPLYEKKKSVAERLNRRRKSAAKTSVKIAADRISFFDRLALLNAGALTFSVTLLHEFVPSDTNTMLILYSAWACLLLALAACLLRNHSHQTYEFSDAASKMAESEIEYIDVDSELISCNRSIVYADSVEPFDKEREININKANRDKWRKEFKKQESRTHVSWNLMRIAEYTAMLATVLGFLLLVAFAIVNSAPRTSYPLHVGPD